MGRAKRTGDPQRPSAGPADSELSGTSVAGIEVKQTTRSRHEQPAAVLNDGPRVAVSAAHVPFDEICQQFGLLDVATSRGARLVDAEAPGVVCADGPGCDANVLGSDVPRAQFVHLSNNRRSS